MNDSDLLRYSRQIMLPEIDLKGQEKLEKAHILIIGAGGLGSVVAMYLAGAGVGNMTIVDHDRVEISNLQRQIIYREDNISARKASVAAQNLKQLNSKINLTPITQKLSFDELIGASQKADLIIDCTDNFAGRFAINRASLLSKTPLVSGAALKFEGQLACFDPNLAHSPCYQCLYPVKGNEDETCAANGILGPVVGAVGILQALEAIKIISNAGEPLIGRLLLFDGLTTTFRTLRLSKDPECPVCAKNQLRKLDK